MESLTLIGKKMVLEYHQSSSQINEITLSSMRRFLVASLDLPNICVSYKRVLALLFPLTSVFLGIGILQSVYNAQAPVYRKITYSIVGNIAVIGLGSIILAIQILYVLLNLILILIESISGKMLEIESLKQNKYLNSIYSTFSAIGEYISADYDD